MTRRVPPAALAALLALARLALVPRFEFVPDEAYYLTWARGAAAVDHPPLVAWLTRAPLALGLRPIELAARVVPVLAALAAALALDALVAALGASRRARLALVALALLPLPAAGALLLTPDAPLLACVSAALALALAPGRPPPAARALGLALLAALALLAKTHALLLLPSLALARRARGAAAPDLPRGWLALAAAAQLAALPWALPSLAFQLAHAFTARGPAAGLAAPPPFPLGGLALFALGQVALALPALALVPRRVVTSPERALAVAALVPVVPVLVSALVRVPEANWSAPSYPALLALLALASDRLPAPRVRGSLAAVVAVAAALHLQLAAPYLPLPPRADPTARLRGWRAWACDRGPLPTRDALPAYALPAVRAVYGPECPR